MLAADSRNQPNIGVLLEQTLGHVSHGRNLQRTLAETSDALVNCRELPYEPSGFLGSLPPMSNWTLRSSLAARSAVRGLERQRPLDALFVHTHVPATLLGSTMARVPTVVSIDATPRQIDSLGGSYQHRVHADIVEAAKWRMHADCFRRASSLVAWSKWAANSLVADYGVERNRIEVIPPGVIPAQWTRSERRTANNDLVRILFVGGDFERKGGSLLVDAFAALQHDPEIVASGTKMELHLVTTAEVEGGEGVQVHRGLTPNSPELIDLFHRCDVFALPTLGDCSPLVLAEAAAAGLPAVATDVGAINETLLDGVTGHLVEPTVGSLTTALRRLVVDSHHRLALGEAAVEHARTTMDSKANALRLLDGVIASAKRTTPRVLLTVSGDIEPGIEEAIDAGERPLADYSAIAKATDASLLDWSVVRQEGSAVTTAIQRFASNNLAMAYHIYRRRHEVDVVISDGEQVGLPLAALFRLGGRANTRHVMIGHRLSPKKKTLPTRVLGLDEGVDEILVYSTSQLHVAKQMFARPEQNVRLIDFMVDTEFFSTDNSLPIRDQGDRPVLSTAGREFRDYPTFIEAVRGLDVDVVIASASPWSRRSDNANTVDLPSNVIVTSLTQRQLRDQIGESDILVMPLQDTDFQAGITTILEAMSMGRPVICSAAEGQTDVVAHGVNGVYVPPGDVAAMRTAIEKLIANPDEAASMGKLGRQLAEERADVRVYADLFAEIVRSQLPA